MSKVNYITPSNTTTIVISTLTSSRIVKLPAASTVSGRILNIKSLNYLNSTIRISTTGLDTLENFYQANSTFYGIISTPNTSLTLASDGILNWMVLGMYRQNVVSTNYFSPANVSNLVVWLDAADPSTIITSTNNTVARWINKALTPSVTWARPGVVGLAGATPRSPSAITGVRTLYGRNVMWFSTTCEMFISTSLTNQSKSFFAVVNLLTGLNSTNPSTLLFGNPSITNLFNVPIFYDSNRLTYNYGIYRSILGTNHQAYVTFSSMTSPVNSPFLLSLVNSTTSNSNIATFNGFTQVLRSSINAASFQTANCNYFIQQHYYSTSFELAELLVYNSSITTNERQEVEGYLAWKWGLNYSQLNTGHPFKFITPLNN
jgi:hypothetical protein